MRHRLFAISVYHGHVPDNDLLKKLLIPFVEENKSRSKVHIDWFTDKLISSYGDKEIESVLSNDDNPIGKELRNQYVTVLDDFFDEDYGFKFKGMWYNYYTDGEWQEQHDHLSQTSKIDVNHFSCIHFLNYDKTRHNSVTFIDPLWRTRCHSLEFKSHNYFPKIDPEVSEGEFIMFPSYLAHEVKWGKPTPDYPRITISFNIEVVKYG